MKRFYLLLLIILLSSLTVLPQKRKPVSTKANNKAQAPPVKTGNESEEFEKAKAVASEPERINALQEFLKNFPKSEHKNRALELIVSARAAIAEEKLRLSETEEGVKLFILAVTEAPKPMSEEFFATVVMQLPTNLFYRGQPKAALEAAKLIEGKIEGNSRQMLALGAFYIGVENAEEAKRVAESVLVGGADLPVESQIAAHQMLGMAHRLNFDMEASANAYAKALELNPNSIVSKRSLAEMKRAIGKTDESAALYREILEKDAADNTAQTGLVLSLFNSGKQAEAEAELAKALAANSNNLFLLVGAAYWYAAHAQPDKAVEYAQKAVTLEPRYTWGQIALARGLMLQKKPLEAEKALLTARQYGNFPTLVYELASVRYAAGLYYEAAAELRTGFGIKDGVLYARLGNRVVKDSKSFIELLAPERRAAIFEMTAADNPENAERLKKLLDFSQKLNAKEANETEITEAAEEFVKGEDNAKTHRQIYVASRLLYKKIALPKILELTQGAVKGVDSSLDVDSPTSAVLADELYESRLTAIERGQLVIVPNVPRPTLLNILRGRIEEIAGWALYQQEKPQDAGIRLKRAVGILPEKSAWWRSSLWRLGASLEADGKPNEALDAYIKSYVNGEPDTTKRAAIEALYQKINGTLDGLDAKIGAKPKTAVSFLVKQAEQPSETQQAKAETSPSSPSSAQTTVPTIENSPSRTSPMRVFVTSNLPQPERTPAPNTEVLPAATPTPAPTPAPKPEETPVPETTATPTPSPTPTPEIKPAVVVEPSPENSPVSETPMTAPETKTEPSPEVKTNPQTPVEPATETIAKVDAKPNSAKPIKTEKIIVEVTDSLKKSSSDAAKTETVPDLPRTEIKSNKTIVEITDPLEKKPPQTKPQSGADKSLFDPVVISVPKTETVKPTTEPAPTVEEKPVATSQSVERKPESQTKTTDEKPKVEDAKLNAGENRIRVIVTENLSGVETPATCMLVAGQTSISLLHNGGNLGVLVGYSDIDGDVSKITATSSSPDNVSVELEPEIGRQSRRAFFVIKSISQKTGIFTVTFDSPCGKKEVQVKVR